MALTLLESAKIRSGEIIRTAIIEVFAQNSDLLRTLPFEDIQGNALKYNQEETLPGIGFRGVNQAYTESTGVVNPVTEPLVIAGGELDVDKFIIRTQGEDTRASHEAMKVKALSHKWTQNFIKGDTSTDPKVFDGLQTRLVGRQLLPAGATSGGDALSLALLDELIDLVEDPTHLIMNRTMRRRLTAAARLNTVGGFITYEQDEFGRQITMYNGLPIILTKEDNTGSEILDFSEANPGGGAAASTSVYCVSFGDGKLVGIQNGGIEVTDLGEIETKPVMRTRVEWYSGVALFHPHAAARLHGIKNVAVVA